MIGTMTQTLTIKPIATYKPLPWQVTPWRDKSFVLLLTGSAGGGKSRLAAEKIHAYCLKYPGTTALMMRKTRQSMTNSTLIFFERKVIGNDPRVTHKQQKSRFEYENGSVLAYGGMADEKQREYIRSIGQDGGVDIVWMEEATRFNEEDFNEVIARVRGKASNWSQIILTTNPDAPTHWIHKRLILGKEASFYFSSAIDNPYNPPEYIDRLNMLTGTQRDRLVGGKWIQAEGAVYPEFSTDNIVTDEPDLSQPFELAFDDGYAVDPRVILFIQRQPTRILVFDEIYDLQKLEEQTIAQVMERCILFARHDVPSNWVKMTLQEKARWCAADKVPLPELAVGSTEAAQLLQRFRIANIPARGGTHKPRTEGVKVVRNLICDANGVRVLQVNARCQRFIEEIQSYVMDPKKDEPLDKDDHGLDAVRYWCWLRARR
jgi:PBSX family phage terminase large subunit